MATACNSHLSQDGRPALTFLGALRIGVPVAAAQCVGLIAGNTAAGLQIDAEFKGSKGQHFSIFVFLFCPKFAEETGM